MVERQDDVLQVGLRVYLAIRVEWMCVSHLLHVSFQLEPNLSCDTLLSHPTNQRPPLPGLLLPRDAAPEQGGQRHGPYPRFACKQTPQRCRRGLDWEPVGERRSTSVSIAKRAV
jgi:hypothetical protein